MILVVLLLYHTDFFYLVELLSLSLSVFKIKSYVRVEF